MGKFFSIFFIIIAISFVNTVGFSAKKKINNSIIINHKSINIMRIPIKWIKKAKKILHIAYGHTSHGQQLIEGMKNLDSFMTGKGYKKNTFAVDFTGKGKDDSEVLNLYKRPWGLHNGTAYDLGRPDYILWVYTTRKYLGWDCASGDGSKFLHYAKGVPNYNANNNCNVVIWAWCAQLSYCSQKEVKNYLKNMTQLEKDYPQVKFIYMTGHVDGKGLNGKLHLRNNIIRKYCLKNNKILYDFEDIESYDPDGNYYGDKYVTDGSNYDYNNNGRTEQTKESKTGWMPATPLNGDRNWALNWQKLHKEGIDWYQCKLKYFHAHHLNVNLKAYASWWLWARLAGWNGNVK